MAKETEKEPAKEPTMAEVMAMFAEIQRQTLENQKEQINVSREQVKQTKKRSNVSPPLISAFNPQGEKDYPMPRLKCEFWMPWIEHPNYHGNTWEEVELLNLIEPGEYMVTLTDGTMAVCNVLGIRHQSTGKLTKMEFVGQIDDRGHYGGFYTKERKQHVPGKVAMLREMLEQKGIDHSHVLTMREREKRTKLPATDPKYLPVSLGE